MLLAALEHACAHARVRTRLRRARDQRALCSNAPTTHQVELGWLRSDKRLEVVTSFDVHLDAALDGRDDQRVEPVCRYLARPCVLANITQRQTQHSCRSRRCAGQPVRREQSPSTSSTCSCPRKHEDHAIVPRFAYKNPPTPLTYPPPEQPNMTGWLNEIFRFTVTQMTNFKILLR